MKFKRVIPLLLAFALCMMPFSAFAQNDYNSYVLDVHALSRNNLTTQQWVDEVVAPEAGSAMDNYIIQLNHHPNDIDFSEYIRSASKKLEEGISNPVSRMRCAYALLSCNAASSIPENIADDSIGKLGVMSYVYGLHLLNNGLSSELWTIESISDKLLSLQKSDGGWTVMGNFSDVDVTAMCLQALACLEENDNISEAIDAAVAFLSEKQLDNGGYSSSGRENAESAAQVIIAAASLGIDPASDKRFIKNGSSVLDALLAYRLPDGSFAHLPGDAEANTMANLQSMHAFTALQQSGNPYFMLNPENAGALNQAKSHAVPSWKLYAWCGIGVFALCGIIYSLTRKYGRMKQLVFVLLLAGIFSFGVYSINLESTEEYYSGNTASNMPADGQVSFAIRCDVVAGFADDGSTPENGVILETTTLPFRVGDSVFDLLTTAVRLHEIHMEHEGGTGDMAYVNGINHLYEYVYGDLSGWMFSVNGVRPSVGCGAYKVEDGDEIIWQYTMNIGEDLK